MKVAVASDGDRVAQHFGHCENFTILDVQDGRIIGQQVIPNPGHKPGFLPNFLNDMGVDVIIAGGMGGGAMDIFNEKGIQAVTGAQGGAQAAALVFAQGTLHTSGSVCKEHRHCDTCGE